MFIWALVILLLTLTPGHSLPKLDMFTIDGIDLIAHSGVFFILALLMTLGFKKQSRFSPLKEKTGMYVIILCTTFGVAIELLQIIIPGRGFEFFDMIANSLGSLMGYYIFGLANKYKTWI